MKRRTYATRNQGRFDFGAPKEGFSQTEFGTGAKTATDFEAFQRQQREKREREDREQRERWEREQQARREQERQYREQSERARRERLWEHFTRQAAQSPWQILGLQQGASQAEIRQAWITLVKQHHPDVGGDPAKFREVQAAFEKLRCA